MTPEQALARLQRDGGQLEAAALRRVLLAFRDADTRSLIAQLAAAMLGANPSERLRARERLLALADALFPPLPDDLLTLTRQAVTLGAEVGAGMVPVAAPFVAPAVARVTTDMTAILKAEWSGIRTAQVQALDRIMTRALTGGGRYPITAEITRATNLTRKQAQSMTSGILMTTLSTAQDSVIGQAVGQNAARVEVEWRAAGDARVRSAHRARDGQRIPYGQSFVRGVTLRYPRDPACTNLGETRRCRCVVKYHVLDD